MTTSEHISELVAALVGAQSAMKPAIKDAKNPHFKSTYADLASVLEAAKVYAAHGIAMVQDVQMDGDGVAVRTRLMHTSGQWLEVGPLVVPVGKRDAHGVGSATTYAKRYALQAALGMASEDDDGNAATVAAPPEAPPNYEDWLLSFESSAANGMEALMKVFDLGSEECRNYYKTTVPQREREALKAKARAVKRAAV